MSEEARNHRKMAANIRELVVNPFARWCDHHALRVQNSQDELQGRIRAHDRQAETVRQYRSAYFNKCRKVEDLDEEEKLAFQDPSSAAAAAAAAAAATTGSPKDSVQSVPSIKVNEEDDDPEPVEIGDETYAPEQVKKMLTHALEHVRLGETKVPILGTYQNVTSGTEITEYIQKHMGGTTISYAEKIGQDLIDNGFLRLVGNMGSAFANSSKMNYQWRTKVFSLTGIPEKRPKLMGRSTTMASTDSSDQPVLGDRVTELWQAGWNPLNNQHPNETPTERLRREAKEADDRYKAAVRKLDELRCNLEEAMVDHLKFMERCELDRLKAIKSVILDFSGALSNVIPTLQRCVDNMMLFQETVQPLGDLRYLLENYRTGNYIPKVVTYENYYNSVDDQTFGVDIEARARADRKRVPLIVTTILTFLDSHYPDLEGDEVRRNIWTVDVPLAATHHLRNVINHGKVVPMEVLEKYEVPIVAAVLKLYLLELPDSLVSSHVYEIVKTIYTSTAQSGSEQARIAVIQSTLGQLRLANIATLDALVTHFTRLIELTSADDVYTSALATTLSPCILRPKHENSLSMTEKYHVRLLKDLFAHKDAIFGELKRQSALTHTNSGATRQSRAVSTSEASRREAVEERHRAIAAAQHAQATSATAPPASGNRGRRSSPAPSSRASLPEGIPHHHRRDLSRAAETRFPISTAATPAGMHSPPAGDKRIVSPTSSSSPGGGFVHRNSLTVPASPPSTRQTPLAPAAWTSPPRHSATPPDHSISSSVAPADHPDASASVHKHDSHVRRATSGGSGSRPVASHDWTSPSSLRDGGGGEEGDATAGSAPPLQQQQQREGVQLQDRPVDFD